MIFSALLSCYLIFVSAVNSQVKGKDWTEQAKGRRCLTGYMTDLQSWVNENGDFTSSDKIKSRSIDVSKLSDVSGQIQQRVSSFKCTRRRKIEYLSMAKCQLTRVPTVFRMQDNMGRALYETLQYLTFYGNNFSSIDTGGNKYDVRLNASEANEINSDIRFLRKQYTMWSISFQSITFESLKELDLRACAIQALGSHTFRRMPKLESLFLGENNIHYIEGNIFDLLTSLRHLDLSRNFAYDENDMIIELLIDSQDIFKNINLESLDLSFSNIGPRNTGIVKSAEQTIRRLSICYTAMARMREEFFNFTQLKYLDVSGDRDILCSPNFIESIRDTVEVLYAEDAAVKDFEPFFSLTKLEILRLTSNEISLIPTPRRQVMPSLQILDLDNNRISSWFTDQFSMMKNLQLLTLRNNNVNVITREMYEDIEKLKYISLSGNFLVCNCYSRDIYDVGLKNEMRKRDNVIRSISGSSNDSLSFHIGFNFFNNMIQRRRNITSFCESRNACKFDVEPDIVGNYLLLDNEAYQCLSIENGRTTDVFNIETCSQSTRDSAIPKEYKRQWNKFFLFIIPALLLPLLLFIYVFRKNFRYFLITLRNSATLSLLNKNIPPDDGTIYHYDVFVSYCNEDRAWVLDSLLPHVERDCNVSVCLHERDFQVGLSILENIVSCMDRSRSIMLIISKRFLLSQWCQFEMHLAQHRLLETRREDLILILLEEIPRNLRPNTLHYLMLTKTYIVWPAEDTEQKLFWRRMKKSLMTHTLKHTDNVSLA